MSLLCTCQGTLLRLSSRTARYNEFRSASTHRKSPTSGTGTHSGGSRLSHSIASQGSAIQAKDDFSRPSVVPELEGLHRSLRRRSLNMILKHLHELSVTDSSHLLTDIDLEAVARLLKPYHHFKTPRSRSARMLYHHRMAYFRKWLEDSGRKVPLSVWSLLLEECRLEVKPEIRQRRIDQTWTSMLQSGVVPDTYCYNSYIATKCVQPADYDRLRLRKKSDTIQDQEARYVTLQAAQHQVQAAVVIYRRMIKDGIQPNAMTIELLILALGKAGNLDALKSLLHQTWNVLLPDPAFEPLQGQGVPDEYEEEGLNLDDDPSENIKEPKVESDSPLYPTQATMISLAMAYGANSQNSLALYAVRSLASTYALTISGSVWSELLKWASIDSAHLRGYTPNSHVEELFELSKTEYGTRPSITMYNLIAKHSLTLNRNPDRAFIYVDDMLKSVEGESTLLRPKFRSSELYPHARAVALKLFRKVKTNLQATLAQLERKRKNAQADGGADSIRLLVSDIERRREHLLETIHKWTRRIRQYDERMRTLVIQHRTALSHYGSDDDGGVQEDEQVKKEYGGSRS